ncbi:MAG TPA: 3,4-dihydroxy-2-butanone-4-phosphate synthase, partial [Candidatus Latescibacteria bacterium]|nr:3,4-dihydroxy-2-butanone-4-phosphate synthase [Candidatus Latescibacterota bacterium]
MPDFDRIEDAIEDIKAGKMVIVVDDEDRENEGDFVMAAEKVTPEAINFMAKQGRGMICLPTTPDQLERLGLEMMVTRNTSLHGTPFTVTIDAIEGTTTGISAQDRALTIKKFIDPTSKPEDFARPGHVFPLRAQPGGVLRRAGHTEATVDLVRLAGFHPTGVLCEIMDEDGTMARVPQLQKIAKKFGLRMISIKDLIEYRRKTEKLVRCIAKTFLPSRFGDFRLYLYETTIDGDHHLALVKGDVSTDESVLVRVHSECLTGDVFASKRCDCGEQLEKALQMIDKEGKGALIYMRQEGRGIGLVNKLH